MSPVIDGPMSSIGVLTNLVAWNRSVSLLFFDRRFGKVAFAEPLVMNTAENGESGDPIYPPDPTITLGHGACQDLMDQLWHCGIRPTEGQGSAGSLSAVKAHLEDMRSVAWAALEKIDVRVTTEHPRKRS